MVLGVLCVGSVLLRYLGCGVGLVLSLGFLLLDDDGSSSMLQKLGDEILGGYLGIGRLYWG